jgi:hypothetical protein
MKINKKSTLREEYFFKVKICRLALLAYERMLDPLFAHLILK